MSQSNFWLDRVDFVGRENIIKDVNSWLVDENLNLIFFKGGYGIGKTRLLHKILDVAKNAKYEATPKALIDLYHTLNHTPEGLAKTLVESFSDAYASYFKDFVWESEELDQARASGDSQKAGKKLEALLTACKNSLVNLSKEKGILILLDTAERWIYPKSNQNECEFAPAWNWLKEWLLELPKGLIVIVGREEIDLLFKNFDNPVAQLRPLGVFSKDEVKKYLEEVALKRRAKGTGLLFKLDDNENEILNNLSGGRPILLALYMELVFLKPEMREELCNALFDSDAFEHQLIEKLINNEKIGPALIAVGRANKGVDTELMSLLRGLPIQDVQKELDDLEETSFVKKFDRSDKLFLHDQLYTLLYKYYYVGDIDIAEAAKAGDAIYKYYKKHMDEHDALLHELLKKVAGEVEFNRFIGNVVQGIRRIETPRQLLKSEFVSYRLRQNIEAGIRLYYRYGHEAATSGNNEILVLLRIELINFLSTVLMDSPWRPIISGLLLVNDIWERVASGQPYEKHCEKNESLVPTLEGITEDQKNILLALLETWRATSTIFSRKPDYEQAYGILTGAIKRTKSVSSQQGDDLYWLQRVVESLAYRQRAYLNRVRGKFQDSIIDFGAGLRNSRAVDFYHEEATLRNDMGFAQMQKGDFADAITNMEDGLQLRYRTAIGPRIVLSYTSLAQYYIYTGAYDEARKRSQYAIRIAEAIGFRRGLAFAQLALGEATRRYAFSVWGESNQRDLLNDARKSIESAIHLFHKLGEQARIIDAELEQACLFRDMLRVASSGSEKDMFFEKADDAFRKVANDANNADIEYRHVDAMGNRIWLGYFAGKGEEKEKRNRMWRFAQKAGEEFMSLDVLHPFWLENGRARDEAKAQLNPILSSQIGRCYMGLGIIDLETWKDSHSDKETLYKAVHNMMLAVEYSTRFAEDHRGLREARRTIQQAFSTLNPVELQEINAFVLEAEKKENIVSPSKLQKWMISQAFWFLEDKQISQDSLQN